MIRANIYYKCPWCVPKEHLQEWRKRVIDHSISLKNQIRKHGGVSIIDSIPEKFISHVKEYPAFDEIINGKEATAYLAHITSQYDNLGNFTLFMQTQPSHHVEIKLLPAIFEYMMNCRLEVDFISLNFRYFSGRWAHEPENCLFKLFPIVFGNTSIPSDKKRFSDEREKDKEPYTLDLFRKTEMAGSTAAQFLVSRDAITRRGYSYWVRLSAINNGSIDICGISTTEKWGGK